MVGGLPCGDVAFGDVVTGYGLGLEVVVLEVFSDLNDSRIGHGGDGLVVGLNNLCGLFQV